MKNIIFIFALIVPILSGCEKEESDFPVSMFAPTIHGYIQTDVIGGWGKQIGDPDVKLTDPRLITQTSGIYKYVGINSYPNPCENISLLYIYGGNANKKIWVVPANASVELANYLNATCMYVQGNPVITLETNESVIELDLSKFKYKYYRVYVEIDGILLWNNIVKL